MPSFRAHSLRFFSVEPHAVTCLSHSPTSPLLAVARADNSVEVWGTQHCLVRRYLVNPEGDGEESSVESLAWAGERLYSCGLHGQVVEYDLSKGREGRRHAVTSGPAWCLAIDKSASKMAVGTEEGFVCLFNITDEGLDYNRVLDRQEGRILCLAWHSDSVHIATGSTDTVRVWNTESGHPIARMTTGRTERAKETIVWCVAFTSDMTVISGDSRGKTSFWNGRNGTLVDSIQSHKADVLSIALSPDQTTAYSTGVDPTLMHFQIIVKGDGRRKWVKSLHRVVSSHDVRSVVCAGDRVYTGGVDTYISHSSYPAARSLTKVPPLPPPERCLAVASEARAVLLAYLTRLELWRLGRTTNTSGAIGSVLPLDSSPVKLVEVGVKEGERLVCSAIHKSAKFMAFCTNSRVRLLSLALGEGDSKPTLTRVKFDTNGQLANNLGLYSINNEDRLLFCGESGGVICYNLNSDETVLYKSLTSQELGLSGPVMRLVVGDTVALIADQQDTVVAVDLDTLGLKAKLPSYREASLCALTMSPNCTSCVMVYSNQRVVEVDINSAKYTTFSSQLASRLPRAWLSRRTAVTEVTYMGDNTDLILLHDDSTLAVIDKEKDMPEPHAKLMYTDPRSTPDSTSETVSSYAGSLSPSSGKDVSTSGLRMSRKYNHLVSFTHLSGDEVIAIEVKPNTIEEQLPPSLKQKKFGGS